MRTVGIAARYKRVYGIRRGLCGESVPGKHGIAKQGIHPEIMQKLLCRFVTVGEKHIPSACGNDIRAQPVCTLEGQGKLLFRSAAFGFDLRRDSVTPAGLSKGAADLGRADLKGPVPQKDGMREGWMFRMRRGHWLVKFSVRMLIKPAMMISSMPCQRQVSIS